MCVPSLLIFECGSLTILFHAVHTDGFPSHVSCSKDAMHDLPCSFNVLGERRNMAVHTVTVVLCCLSVLWFC